MLDQRSGESGSPGAVGSTNASRSCSNVWSTAVARLRPPPGRRVRSGGSGAGSSSSRSPRLIVAREIPVARSTAAMPPWPRARASVAAHTRLDRSVNTGANAACLARSVANGTRHRTTTPCRVQVISTSYLLTDPEVSFLFSCRQPAVAVGYWQCRRPRPRGPTGRPDLRATPSRHRRPRYREGATRDPLPHLAIPK